MIWVVAEGLGTNYGSWVKLYQSNYFKDEYPEDNQRFQNVTYTKDVDRDREKSLRLMRERMFSAFNFTAAVFIGGMGGVVEEYNLLQQLQPNARLLPIVSTGGAAVEIGTRALSVPPDLRDDLDYVAVFHRHLGISVREERYRTPSDQPKVVSERYWRHPASDTEAS